MLIVNGPHRQASASGRRVRILFNGHFIVDTTKAIHVWEHPRYPQFYVPRDAIKDGEELGLTRLADVRVSDIVVAQILKLEVNGKSTDRVIRFVDKQGGKLAGYLRFEFGAMGKISLTRDPCDKPVTRPGADRSIFDWIDQWFEEDTPIYIHPKDPTKRIDILPSSRHLQIRHRPTNTIVASTPISMHLIEPLLPVRYYLPPTSISPTLLRKTTLKTGCPYKGEAEYYDVLVGNKWLENAVWYYRFPTHECAAIAGMVCFYTERGDGFDVLVDGKIVNEVSGGV